MKRQQRNTKTRRHKHTQKEPQGRHKEKTWFEGGAWSVWDVVGVGAWFGWCVFGVNVWLSFELVGFCI